MLCLRRPFWRSRFCVSYRYKAPPTTKKAIFRRGAPPHEERNTGQQAAAAGFRALPNRQSTHAARQCVCSPFVLVAHLIGRQTSGTANKQSSCGGLCRSVFQCAPPFAVGISPTLEKLCKDTAFFAYTQARARKKHKKRKKTAFCTIFLCRTCRFARKSPI